VYILDDAQAISLDNAFHQNTLIEASILDGWYLRYELVTFPLLTAIWASKEDRSAVTLLYAAEISLGVGTTADRRILPRSTMSANFVRSTTGCLPACEGRGRCYQGHG
jgi:hypothetical protein